MSQSLHDAARDIMENDIVIALMGPTGVGKSNFINVATKTNSTTASGRLRSCTDIIHAVRCVHPRLGRRVVFVDTPGFDDTTKPDTEILKMVADWLKETYKNDTLLTGIIYLHRITDNRMGGSPLRNLQMFSKLCGQDAVSRVVLATTMWSEKVSEAVGSERERQLKDQYWKGMIDAGSITARFNNKYGGAWEIVDKIIERYDTGTMLLLQEELEVLKRDLSETEAGKALYNRLQQLLSQQKETLRKLSDAAKAQNDPALVEQLEARYMQAQADLQKTFEDAKRMKISLVRRFWLLFARKPHTQAVVIHGAV